MTEFSMQRDINGQNSFAPSFTADNYNVQLAINTVYNFTVPPAPIATYTKWEVIFGIGSGSNIWVALNDVASVPTGSIAKSSSQLNPQVRVVNPGDVISVVTADTGGAWFGMSLYNV